MVGMNTQKDVIWKTEAVDSKNRDEHEHSLDDDGQNRDRQRRHALNR